MRVLGPMTVPIMEQCGVDFAGRGSLIELMLSVGMPHWFDGLGSRGGSLLTTFLDHLPGRDALDAAAIKKLDRLMRGTSSLALARPLFERIYVPLNDATYSAAHRRTSGSPSSTRTTTATTSTATGSIRAPRPSSTSSTPSSRRTTS